MPCAARVPAQWRPTAAGLDLTGRADATGRVHTVLGLIDHGSRVALRLARLPRKCGWTLLGHLCLAIARWGKPTAVRTDNEACFTGRVFTAGLRVLGIGHQRTQLHSPWQNGRIERLFGTLKWTLKPVVLIDGPMLDRFLGDFVRWYNALRPHQALAGATPKQAREGVDPWHAPQPPRQVRFVEGWAGRMVGFVLRR